LIPKIQIKGLQAIRNEVKTWGTLLGRAVLLEDIEYFADKW